MSSSDDGASRLSETLDEVMGTAASSSWSIDDEPENEPESGPDPGPAPSVGEAKVGDDTGELDWSVDDLPPDDDHAAPPPAEQTDDGVLEARDIEVPDHDDDSLPAGEAGFVLPEIVQATADAPDEPEAATAPAQSVAQPVVAPVAPAAPATQPGAPLVQVPVAAAATAPAPVPAPTTNTGWHEHVPSGVTTARAGSTRTPTRRPRVRRVTRVLRHIDPWSTFKLALLFSLVAYVSILTSGVLLWRVADTTGALDNVERWFTQFGWETFEFKGGEIFSNAWVIGLFGVVFATGGAVLLVTLFNLVSDIIGGIRLTVLEEEVVERTVSSNRRYVVRRPGAVDAVADSAAVPAWSLDDGEAPSEVASGPAAATSAVDPMSAQPDGVDDWSVDDDPSPANTG